MLMETPQAQVEHPQQPPTELLALRNLSKCFGATQALNDVSIDFRPGEIHCLLGENGAGKSTIGKIAGGLYEADSGTLFWEGQQIALHSINDAHRCGIALVFQELSLAPDLSVRANLLLGKEGGAGLFHRLRHAEEARTVQAVLGSLDLELDIEQPVNTYPVATQQMLEITKAMMLSPKLLILDEPTAMLGAVEKGKLFEILRRLKAEGTAIVMITHHIDDVMEVADHVSVMRNGRLVDSFRMGTHITADTVLERLTGKPVHSGQQAGKHRDLAQVMLEIENVDMRDGTTGHLQVHRGEIVGFYGVVGSGAELLLQRLVGLINPQPLRLLLDGQAYLPRSPADAAKLGVAYLPSGRASNCIFSTLSIKQNLSLALLRALGRYGVVSEKAEADHTHSLLDRFKVKYGDANDLITSLSGGNQQKVLMARAIARATRLLVLEEPTAGIDIDAKMQIHDHIRALANEGVSVVLLSSDLLETVGLCDTVYTMFSGRIVRAYSHPTLDDQPTIISDVLGQSTGSDLTSKTNEASGC